MSTLFAQRRHLVCACYILLVFQSFNYLIPVWCTDPKVVIRQTFPYTTSANNYKYIIVPKDTDIYMACVVDNIGPQNKVSCDNIKINP